MFNSSSNLLDWEKKSVSHNKDIETYHKITNLPYSKCRMERMKSMQEEWKKIEYFPNYSVSNLGRVRNDKTGKFLKPHKAGKEKNQYFYTSLVQEVCGTQKTFLIHRLVAFAFIPNPDNKPEVNHIDGNHFNNTVDNLEWVTERENRLHAYRVLNLDMGFGHSLPKKVLRVEDGQVFDSVRNAAYACGLKDGSNISRCLSGKRQKAGGYHWKYYE